MSSSNHDTYLFSIRTKSRKRSLNLNHVQSDSPWNRRYILQKSRKTLRQTSRRYRFHWQSTASLNRLRLQIKRRATVGRILLYSTSTKKTLPIRVSKEDYNFAAKALGGEFCNFLVDKGIMCGKTPAKGAMLSL
jgi:hypothetical protein